MSDISLKLTLIKVEKSGVVNLVDTRFITLPYVPREGEFIYCRLGVFKVVRIEHNIESIEYHVEIIADKQ